MRSLLCHHITGLVWNFIIVSCFFSVVQITSLSQGIDQGSLSSEVPAENQPQPSVEAETFNGEDDEIIRDPRQHPSYLEFQRIMAKDDEAQLLVNNLIKKAEAYATAGADVSQQAINSQIFDVIQPVREAYEDFLRRYPNHVGAHLALGSFLSDFGEEVEGMERWEKARELDPANPAAWNNLAGFYGHFGPIRKSFEYYEKAIALVPNESIYWSNLATMTQVFRKDALAYYDLEDDQAVIRKSLEFYQKAWAMNPNDFPLATDIGQTYYFLTPFDFEAAEKAWKRALLLAGDDIEREGIHIHQARIHIRARKWDEASSYLSRIQHPMYQSLKATLEKRLEREKAEVMEEKSQPQPQPQPQTDLR